MRIMGIDPGTVCCGYGIVETNRKMPGRSHESGVNLCSHSSRLVHVASGDIKMNRKDPLPERLKVLYHSLKAIFDTYNPVHVCIEKVFYHKSFRAAMALGSTRGITMLLAAENSIPLFEYNPTELKMALTGYGRAEKRQVNEMVKIILNLNDSVSAFTEDTTDALALCICHINSSYQNPELRNQKLK